MEPIILITTTTDNREALEKIGRHLVTSRLIACIQIIGPVKSIYRWKDKIEETEEWLGIMKTRKSLYAPVEAEIRALHTYELPEIVAFEASNMLLPYQEWVRNETRMGQKT
jgi:periplasmic divalent cation tolerance protein